MARGPLYDPAYRPQFSGHETFPLRYGWLKKGFDAVHADTEPTKGRSLFTDDDAIARFGVGKNMVTSMRHWLSATGFIEDGSHGSAVQTTDLGRLILPDDGLDPYLENPATLWLIHWQLSGRSDKTTWFWVFNHFHVEFFEREHVFVALGKLAAERSWRVAPATLKRDVECFVRSYAAKHPGGKSIYEEALESPLAELGLIKPVGRRDGFRLVRGAKPSLKSGVFLYALIDFWERFTHDANTLSFEAIAHEPGSPGRVFLLGENDILEYLLDLEDRTEGKLKWSETAGLKQIIRTGRKRTAKEEFLRTDYLPRAER